jgi:Stage II sporulation protein E (SpoIIE)
VSGRSFVRARRAPRRAAPPVSRFLRRGQPLWVREARVRGRRVSWVLPLLIFLAIAVSDQVTPAEVRTTQWVVLGPAVAAALCGVWVTVGCAVLSWVLFWVLDRDWPHLALTGVPDFTFVATAGLLSVVACVVRLRREYDLLHVQDIAEAARRVVLRALPPGMGGLDHAAVYLTADTVARIGGDFYDIQPSPYGTRVLLGDVQGKGLGAVDVAGGVMGTFREAAYHEVRLRSVARRMEVRMRRQVALREIVGVPENIRFATAVLASFPADEAGVLEMCNFGHEPPLVVSSAGVRELACEHGLPLGLGELGAGPATAGLDDEDDEDDEGDEGGEGGAGAAGGGGDGADGGERFAPVGGDAARLPAGVEAGPKDRPWTQAYHGEPPPLVRVPLAPGETLLLVTDGVTEARDREGHFYDLCQDVACAVAADPDIAEPWRLVSFVRARTLRHTGGHLADDTTIFAVRPRYPSVRSGASLVVEE